MKVKVWFGESWVKSQFKKKVDKRQPEIMKEFNAFVDGFRVVQSLMFCRVADPNALLPGKGVSLLHLIIGHQSESFAFKIAKLFLRCGGDPNVRSSDGVTPIHVAAAWGRNRILHLLLINGGDPWLQDDEKKNAFNYAFEERKWDTIEMLHHFQQMHSAAIWKKDLEPEQNSKIEISLEKLFSKKRESIHAYLPVQKCMKSTTTQTQYDFSVTPLSPVQNKIKYFEPEAPHKGSPDALSNSLVESDKVNVGWLKDFYQTSCEVIVHCNSEIAKDKNEKPETFVSSLHIDASPQKVDPPAEEAEKIKSSLDVRNQLFVELQEAVRRRSKQKVLCPVVQHEAENSLLSDSLLGGGDPSEKDSFVAKEVSYLYGVDLEDNQLLKNMSDFATKVMKEIELGEENSVSQATIDLCVSSPELTNMYLSCDEEPRNVIPVIAPNSENSTLYLTPYDSNLNSNIIAEESKEKNSNESFASVLEDGKNLNLEKGAVLSEKKFLHTPTVSLNLSEEGKMQECDKTSTSPSASGSVSYDSDVLRYELTGLGYKPGPVTKTTKKLYLKKLQRLKTEATGKETNKKYCQTVFSPALDLTLKNIDSFTNILSHRVLEEEMCRSFDDWSKRKWREGANKTSFNYLLLDPRLSLNLPKRAPEMTTSETWKSFLSAIFYVGKGKRSRPYAHLHQATAFWQNIASLEPDEKTETILEIWKGGWGVVCLQVFQNVIPVEALTREAAMIDAIGLSNLKNARAGEYYGTASTWSSKKKVDLGIFLLHKAMLIFLNEGERQIKPYDID